MERENITRIIYALNEDCGNLITLSEEKKILDETLQKLQAL